MPEAYLHLNNNVKDKLWKMICSLLFLCVISGNCVVYSTFPNGTGPNRKEGKVWAVLPDNVPSFDRGLSKVHVAPASTPMKKFNSTNSRRSKFRREVVRMPRFYRRRSDLTSSGIVMSRHTPDRWLDASYDLRYGCPPGCQCGYLEVECRQMQLQGVPRGIPLSTEKLILVGNEIESLNRSSFEGLSNLKTLVVSNNRIRSIEPRTFDHLTSLRRLRLNRNELKSLSRDVLSGLSQLQRIDLRHNKLTCLDADLFRDLPELRHMTTCQTTI
ncbi:leucine-rich repeat and immunoglobulin-like domain-containing nogo receptor-interacting protein 1 [Clonorchis sinensis]|uniref:Leucine-rich repeat and immunoglobulin-like domain-containing nogo receptor-interacting protein 1 n=1 Tax=Clonorchis sinensis TaxID=79923 RepID=G7YHH0_CLOSI|nr:leucine-rich repeat and immunoglobulin-like domain-containing nogo receptor-interacting protein 1 [Clonorchis sinensis]